jgi:hypothetical protein
MNANRRYLWRSDPVMVGAAIAELVDLDVDG